MTWSSNESIKKLVRSSVHLSLAGACSSERFMTIIVGGLVALSARFRLNSRIRKPTVVTHARSQIAGKVTSGGRHVWLSTPRGRARQNHSNHSTHSTEPIKIKFYNRQKGHPVSEGPLSLEQPFKHNYQRSQFACNKTSKAQDGKSYRAADWLREIRNTPMGTPPFPVPARTLAVVGSRIRPAVGGFLPAVRLVVPQTRSDYFNIPYEEIRLPLSEGGVCATHFLSRASCR